MAINRIVTRSLPHTFLLEKHQPFPQGNSCGHLFMITKRKSSREIASIDNADHCRPAQPRRELFGSVDPFIGGDGFISMSTLKIDHEDTWAQKRQHELKEEVKGMLVEAVDDGRSNRMPLEKRLGLVESVQRLGLEYHFEREVNDMLLQVYERGESLTCDDLRTASLSFRLLRSQGYNVPSSIFEKFMEEKGEFKESLTDDVEALLALYEASYMYIHGEEILERAQTFATIHLRSILPKLKEKHPLWLESQVMHALHRPLQRNVQRLEALRYISIYKEIGMPFGEALLEFAVVDYNIVQSMHRREIKTIIKWWNEFDFGRKLHFARHRPSEIHLWSIMLFSEPKYAMARIWTTKMTYIMSLIDDSYDSYGTLEELEFFLDAIKRMDNASISKLPEYMQELMSGLQSVYDEIGENTQGRPYILDYVKQQIAMLAWVYSIEVEWLREKHVPSIEEYMNTMPITAGMTIFPATYFAGMGNVATKDIFHWACDAPIPSFVRASGVICRMQDDLAAVSDELKGSTLGFKSFMKELRVSEEAARAIMQEIVKDAFKEMNKGLLHGPGTISEHIPRPILKCMMNHARASDVFHRYDDGYSAQRRFNETVSSLLVKPIVQ